MTFILEKSTALSQNTMTNQAFIKLGLRINHILVKPYDLFIYRFSRLHILRALKRIWKNFNWCSFKISTKIRSNLIILKT